MGAQHLVADHAQRQQLELAYAQPGDHLVRLRDRDRDRVRLRLRLRVRVRARGGARVRAESGLGLGLGLGLGFALESGFMARVGVGVLG